MASFKCPNCGNENELSQPPRTGSLIRCGHCDRLFSVADSQDARQEGQHPAPEAAALNGTETVQPEHNAEPEEIAKDLAQAYFSDIPEGPFAKDGADGSGKVWSSEEEDISDEERRRQQQRLFQFAQESAVKKKKGQGKRKNGRALLR